MNHELIIAPKIEYKQAEVKINDYEALKQAVQAYADRYKGLTITEATYKEATDTRAELRKVMKALDKKRKEIKREAAEPILKFEAQVKSLVEIIDATQAELGEGINEVKEQRRQAKLEYVQGLIDEMAPNYEIDPSEVEIKPSWLNKSTPNKKIVDEIAGTMRDIDRQKAKLATEQMLIELTCHEHDLDPSGWYAMLDGVIDVNVVIEEIERYAKEKQEADELKQKQKEAELAEQKAKLAEINGKQVDTETGAVMVSKQVVSFKIKGTKEQLDAVAKFIIQSNIEVLEASDRQEIIEEEE